MSARQKIEKESNYSYVASKLLLFNIHKEVFGESRDSDVFEHQYKLSFVRNIKLLVKEKVLNKELLNFDLNKLSEEMICIPNGWWVTKEQREYIMDCIKGGW